MSKHKILHVCQELSPYMPESTIAVRCRQLLQSLQDRGNDVRTFLPRFGCINERRNQLHQVIRLSGMNVIIDNDDHNLIIKVASIPLARTQVYFIHNEDYFRRKSKLTDEEGNLFPDNDERALFFARGVLETVKKLRWEPSIVHCHGWFSSVMPIYLKTTFAKDPSFRDCKIAVSLYDDDFEGTLNPEMLLKLEKEGMKDEKMKIIKTPSYENLTKLVIDYADGVVIEETGVDKTLIDYARAQGKRLLNWDGDKSDNTYMDIYQKFYDEL